MCLNNMRRPEVLEVSVFICLVGSYLDTMVASKYTTKQAIPEVMEQKVLKTKCGFSNCMVYWINLKYTVRNKEKVVG